ncbi:MAG: hypothetical protein WC875_00145 [Candidatus Absconditabacterales bacterium]
MPKKPTFQNSQSLNPQSLNHGFFYRFPRIVAIILMLFISIFALDIFGNGYTFRQTVVGLFMHLIPTWILLITLILSRKKYPLVGAIAFTAFGLRYAIINIIEMIQRIGGFTGGTPPYYLILTPLIIALPALAVGLSFFYNRRYNRKK